MRRGSRGGGRGRGQKLVHGGRDKGFVPRGQNHNSIQPLLKRDWRVTLHQDENLPSGPNASASGSPSVNTQSLGQSSTQIYNSFQGGFIAKLKLWKTIAITEKTKKGQSLIDSGGTSHFF